MITKTTEEREAIASFLTIARKRAAAREAVIPRGETPKMALSRHRREDALEQRFSRAHEALFAVGLQARLIPGGWEFVTSEIAAVRALERALRALAA